MLLVNLISTLEGEGEGRRQKGEGRREKGEGRREKGECNAKLVEIKLE